jgi:hypothetical protein
MGGGGKLENKLYAQQWWRRDKKMDIFPRFIGLHGGGHKEIFIYAQIGICAWWRTQRKASICPNSQKTWWKFIKKSLLYPRLELASQNYK